MGGVLFVDPGAAGPSRLTFVPSDRTSPPVAIVARSPHGAFVKVEEFVAGGDVDRVVVDTTGVGLAFYEHLRTSWVITSKDVALSGVNLAELVVVP